MACLNDGRCGWWAQQCDALGTLAPYAPEMNAPASGASAVRSEFPGRAPALRIVQHARLGFAADIHQRFRDGSGVAAIGVRSRRDSVVLVPAAPVVGHFGCRGINRIGRVVHAVFAGGEATALGCWMAKRRHHRADAGSKNPVVLRDPCDVAQILRDTGIRRTFHRGDRVQFLAAGQAIPKLNGRKARRNDAIPIPNLRQRFRKVIRLPLRQNPRPAIRPDIDAPGTDRPRARWSGAPWAHGRRKAVRRKEN